MSREPTLVTLPDRAITADHEPASPARFVDVAASAEVAAARRRWSVPIDHLTRAGVERGVVVEPAKLALVFLGRQRLESWYPATTNRPHYWTRTQVAHLLDLDVPNVCAELRIIRPEVAVEVWLLIVSLQADGLLHTDSDDLDDLLAPLRCAGVDEHGRLADLDPFALHPIAGRCRCFEPTDTQIRLGLEARPTPIEPASRRAG